jgi:hypothetical protein
MMYIDFEAGNKNYKLRLNTRNTVVLEKQLGCNPLSIFGDGNKIPTVTAMVTILYSSLQQYNHGITLNDAYDIFDKWLEDGHSSTDFIPVILEIYQASGLVPKDAKPEDNEEEGKND